MPSPPPATVRVTWMRRDVVLPVIADLQHDGATWINFLSWAEQNPHRHWLLKEPEALTDLGAAVPLFNVRKLENRWGPPRWRDLLFVEARRVFVRAGAAEALELASESRRRLEAEANLDES